MLQPGALLPWWKTLGGARPRLKGGFVKAELRAGHNFLASKAKAGVKHIATKGAETAAEVADILTKDSRFQSSNTNDGFISVIVTSPTRSTRKHAATLFEVERDLPLLNGFSTTVKKSQLKKLIKDLPAEARINVDRPIQYQDPHKSMAIMMDGPPVTGPTETAAIRLPGLDKVWAQGYTGKGQTVAIIDSGIYPHPDLKDKVVGWVDIAEGKKKPLDPFGHGTHVAGVLAGSGVKSEGKVHGVAPDVNLVGVRITSVSEAIKALQWVMDNREKYNIGVVNMSLGDYAAKSYKDDPWAQATQKAIDMGLTVVVAAGNEGPNSKTISTPGILPGVITVGAYDDKGTPEIKDDTVASFSSRGPTIDGLPKPDVLAPGVRVFGTLSPGSTMDNRDLPHVAKDYVAISGTSQATPMVAGLAAILKQANPKLTHADIQKIIIQSAIKNLPDDVNAQGAGLVQADKALDLALHWQTA